jgi:hypothetical protein
MRVRHDKIDQHGAVTLRYRSKLHHIGMGRRLNGTRVILLVAGRHVRVISENGELLRELVLDPSRDSNPAGRARCPLCSATPVRDVPRLNKARPEGFEPPNLGLEVQFPRLLDLLL